MNNREKRYFKHRSPSKASWVTHRRVTFFGKRLYALEVPEMLNQRSIGRYSQQMRSMAENVAFSKNVPVTTLDGNRIIRTYRTGVIEILKVLPPTPKIELPQVFEIGK